MAKKLTQNEIKLQNNISVIDYYNKFIVPTANKFYALSPGRKAGLCPFHDDTDPSFHFWEETKMFHCFGCQASGDVIKLHQMFEWKYHGKSIGRKAAIKELGSLYGIELDEDAENVDEEGLNPFERAKKLVSDRKTVVIDYGAFSLASFRRVNNSIMNLDRGPEQKVKIYNDLDKQLTEFLLKGKGDNSEAGSIN